LHVLGAYYETAEELQVFGQVLASFKLGAESLPDRISE